MSYTFKDLAAEVLANVSTPLTANEIWAKAKEMGLVSKLSSQGQTPEATLGARLYDDVKKDNSRFVAIGDHPKRFQLKEQPREDFVSTILPLPPEKEEDTTSSLQVSEPASPHYSFLECAEKVLATVANKQPMHYKDITEIAIAKGWLQSNGLTPDASLYAQVLTQIQRAQERGKTPTFVKFGKGRIGLFSWQESPTRQAIKRHNDEIQKKLLARLFRMPPKAFEQLICELLEAMGFEHLEVTPFSNDAGIDVRGTWTVADGISQRYAVQVKRWKNNVQAPVVQAVRGSLRTGELGLIVTTSDFSKGARQEAKDQTRSCPISLVNGSQLVELLTQYEMGVHCHKVDLLELDEASAE